jgi:two-component system sensor histidine kinase DegS
MPAVLNDLGLIPSLREFFNDIQKKVDFRLHFFTRDVPGRFGREKELAVYRIVQESITNIIKHSMAKQVHVNLFHKNGKLSLSVEDDGVGFEKHSKLFMNRKRRQLGLLIMKERTIQLGGEFYIESEVNKGTHILAEIPLDLSSDEADTQQNENP